MPISESLRNKKARFLNCELNCNSGHMFIDDKEINLEPMIFQFLLLLIEQQGQIIPKNEVTEKLWNGKKPTDEAVRALVKKTREALGDNARNPIFIKTIPTKGYLLIPTVDIRSTQTQSWITKHKKVVALIGLVVTIVLSVAAFWFVSAYKSVDTENIQVKIDSKLLADLQGKVNAYYTDKGIINIVSHEFDSKLQNSLLLQNLDMNEQLMLSFEEPITGDVWLASSHIDLLVMRKENLGFYHVNFVENWLSPLIYKYDFPLPEGEQIVGTDYNASNLYLFNEMNLSLSRFDIDSGEISQPLAFQSFSNSLKNDLGKLSSDATIDVDDNEQALGQYKSIKIQIFTEPKNQKKVFWSEVTFLNNAVSTKLSFFDSFNQEQANEVLKLSNSLMSNPVWDKNGTRLSFVDNNGELFSYQLNQQALTSWRMGGTKLTNILADCGQACFVVAKQQGLPKLVNTNLRFKKDASLHDNAFKHAVFTASDTRNRLETLPQYVNSNLYFLAARDSKLNQTEQIFTLNKRNPDGKETVEYTFPINSDVQEFVINKSESLALGIINQRPFLLDIKTQSLEFLNLKSPSVKHLQFGNDDLIKFASDQVLQITPNDLNSDNSMAVYTYNINNKMIDRIAAGSVTHEQLVLNDLSETEPNRFTASLRITESYDAVLTSKDNGIELLLGSLEADCIRCFQIINGHFYYIGRKSSDNASLALFKVNMLSGEKDIMSLPETFHSGEFLKQFTIDSNNNSLVLVQRQNLQTDLTQLTGMQQIF